MPTSSAHTRPPRLSSPSLPLRSPSPAAATDRSSSDASRLGERTPNSSPLIANSFSIDSTSAPNKTATLSASSSQVLRSPVGGDDFEMEPVMGHRRRRSTLNAPAGQSSSRSNSRAQAARVPLGDEPKISEESAGVDEPGVARDESGLDDLSDEDLHDDEETGLTRQDKRRKQNKRRRNTRLDQRIVREKNLTADERKEADQDVFRRLMINGALILLWYFFSLSISLYNKWMFDRDRLNFAFPLFTTSMHMLVQFALASVVLYVVPSLRPHHGHNSDLGSSRHEMEPNSTPGMTKMFYLTRIGPCGAATGLDIGLGNTSLKFISLTFYTMCKSSSLAFVLLFAFAFRLETPTCRLITIIATMTLGVVLMVFGEVEFKLGGFLLVISAAFFSGFRWGLTQILLLRNPATSNPFSSIFFLTPVMFVTLLSIAIPVEGFGALLEGLRTLSAEWGTIMTPLFLLFPGCIAFCMTASEFALLQRTSVVTLSIAGIFKEVVTISAASLVFHDRLTLINFVGLLTTMLAIMSYNYIKITKMRQEAQITVHDRHLAEENPSSSSIDGSDMGDDEDDDDEETYEETTGLLRRSFDHDNTLITSDGDFQPMIPPSQAGPSSSRARRID